MESSELNKFYGVGYEDEYSDLTPELIEILENRLKSKVGSKREVVVAAPIPDDIDLWNNAVKVVVERHKDALQSLADK